MPPRRLIAVRGRVTLYETPYDRPVPAALLRRLWSRDNHITDNGLLVIAAALAGGASGPTIGGVAYDTSTVANLFVTTMKVGTSASPTAPADADTALAGAVAITLTTTAETITGGARFSGVVPADQLVGQTLSEEGLFTAGGAMVARVLLSQAKGSLGIQISHDIFFDRSA